jgi:surface antigen
MPAFQTLTGWMKKTSKYFLKKTIFITVLIGITAYFSIIKFGLLSNPFIPVGAAIDSFNGVKVHYNGAFSNISGRHISADGYNIGLKYQCVEFVKRYYLYVYKHKMPNSYGNAVDFFNKDLVDNSINIERGLKQYTNPSKYKPQVGDLLIYNSTESNPYGHVSIVSAIFENKIEVIQQNTGGPNSSRETFKLLFNNGLYFIKHDRILGFLRIQ